MEIGSNDGYLLQYYHRQGIPVLGIEPAVNVAWVAQEQRGIRTLSEFFNEKLAWELRNRGEQADVIHAHNVLAHVADLHGFVGGIRVLLKDDGLAVIEVPYVKDLIDRCEFDTIYHEHLCYFSLTALDQLFRWHDMILADVERIPIHGGSLRLFVTDLDQAKSSNAVEALLQDEAAWGVRRMEYYFRFGDKVEQIKLALRSLLESLKSNGKRIAAYGAAAKGTVLLNYCGLGNESIDFVVDRNPHKHNRFVPGVRLPVLAPSQLVEQMPHYTLLLSWNIADEVLKQQAEYRSLGGRFIIPLGDLKVV